MSLYFIASDINGFIKATETHISKLSLGVVRRGEIQL